MAGSLFAGFYGCLSLLLWQGFPPGSEQGFLSVVVLGLPIVLASLVAVHRL